MKFPPVVDVLVDLLGYVLTGGQGTNTAQGEVLVTPYEVDAVVVDECYDVGMFAAFVEA
ncbi:MAG: hypothetical protein KatS3mg015_2420 [Fimbriimonadales bacterium]|nr:MAG: hypothetical protein KatS3mg015_2420 [Fimbriimonadales bacterium]